MKVWQQDLEEMGVEVKLNAAVSNITQDGVYIGKELIKTENIIWAAGNKATSLVQEVTQHFNRMGQAIVRPDLSIKENKRIFCIGDCAYYKDKDGNILPAVAQGAIQSGDFVADQISADLLKKKRKVFKYKNKGEMATIGRSSAIAVISGVGFSGFLAWLLWGIVHIIFLIDFRNRFIVVLDWIVSYLTHRRSVRLINMYSPDKN